MINFDGFRHIKYKNTEKLFWNKYPFKIILRYNTVRPEYNNFATLGKSHQHAWTDYNTAKKIWVDEFKKIVQPIYEYLSLYDDYKITKNKNSISVFFTDKFLTFKFVEQFSENISEVARPLTDYHEKYMKQNEKVLLKSWLIWGSFRWKVTIDNFKSRTDYEEYVEWATEFYKNNKQTCYLFNTTIYLTEDDGLLMVKMVLSDRIKKIEQVILDSELKNEQNTSSKTNRKGRIEAII